MGSTVEHLHGQHAPQSLLRHQLQCSPVLEYECVSGITDLHNNYVISLHKIFREVLEPLYGDQTEALAKISAGEDRVCYLATLDGTAVGVLQFKTEPTDEFIAYGVHNSVEIKSLFLYRPETRARRGLGSQLLGFLEAELARRRIQHSMLHATVSEEKTDSLIFFMKKDFSNRHKWKGRYKEGTYEFLMVKQTDNSIALLTP